MQSYSDDGIGDPGLRHPVRGGTIRPRQPLDSRCALHRIVQRLGSQAELARQLGFTRASKIRWWVAKGRVPAKWVHQVARVGGVPVSDLVADWRLNDER